MQINDGTGRGYSAKVSENGRVSVDADDGCLAAAKRGEVYVLTTHSDHPSLATTSTGGVLALITNSDGSRKSLVIDSILVGCSAAALSVSVETNYTIATPGQVESGIEIPSTNTAYPTGSSATATGYVWDESNHGITNVTSGVAILRTFCAAGPTELVPSGRIIVAPGGNIGISQIPVSGTPEVSFAIRFYEVDDHTYI